MEVKRTEHKIILNRMESMVLRKRLDAIMPRDQYCKSADGYLVRSLYFDTIGDRCCAEKEEGLRIHEKIRIRIYGSNDGVIKLESKRKVGAVQTKKTLVIDRDTCEALIRGEYDALLKLDSPLAMYFYKKLRMGMFPKVIIEYRRLSYCLRVNNTRITIDSDIRATESNLDLFREKLQAHPILAPDLVIAEVKFNNFLMEYIKNALSGLNRSPTSFSKYFSGRTFYRHMI